MPSVVFYGLYGLYLRPLFVQYTKEAKCMVGEQARGRFTSNTCSYQNNRSISSSGAGGRLSCAMTQDFFHAVYLVEPSIMFSFLAIPMNLLGLKLRFKLKDITDTIQDIQHIESVNSEQNDSVILGKLIAQKKHALYS